MCLSETEAESSLADITTSAEHQEDGSYRVRGSKKWISGGEHDISENIVHLVLSRTDGAPAGTRGLSLFVVPKYLVADDGTLGERNDIELVGLNHKMGYRGTVNTVLSFGAGWATPAGRPGAVGYLVGEESAGLAYMFHMMNEARIGVGSGAAAIGYAGYRYALAYSRERVQGRLAWDKDPAAQPVPIIAHPDVRRMLLQAKAYVEGALALVLYAARLDDDLRRAADDQAANDARAAAGRAHPSRQVVAVDLRSGSQRLAIQMLGSYGSAALPRRADVPRPTFHPPSTRDPRHRALDLFGRELVMKEGAGLRPAARAYRGDSPLGASSITGTSRMPSTARRVRSPTSPRASGGTATRRLPCRRPVSASTPSGTWWSRGSGWTSCWRWRSATTPSQTANALRRATPTATNCPCVATLQTTAGPDRLFLDLDPACL